MSVKKNYSQISLLRMENLYFSTNNNDSDKEECLYCNEPFKNDMFGKNEFFVLTVAVERIKCVQE